MFDEGERDRLRAELVAAAEADPRITGAALTGSAALGREDRWSDIDLALGLAEDADQDEVLAGWTERMYTRHAAVHHLDLRVRHTVYRVFLLGSTLQVDVAFAPAAEFGALAPSFRLLFGAARPQPEHRPPAAADLIGMGWLYALHARSAIERGRSWQAEHMLSGLRERVLALACLRHGVPTADGRGLHLLPAPVTAPLTATLVRSLDEPELRRAFRAATEALLTEAGHADPALAARLTTPLTRLATP